MKIQIFGPGYHKCQCMAVNAKRAVQELGIDCDVEKISDPAAIKAAGVTDMPALVVDGQIKGAGRLFAVDEIMEFIS